MSPCYTHPRLKHILWDHIQLGSRACGWYQFGQIQWEWRRRGSVSRHDGPGGKAGDLMLRRSSLNKTCALLSTGRRQADNFKRARFTFSLRRMLADLAHKLWDFAPASVRSRSIQSCDVAVCLVRVSELDVLSLPVGSGQVCSYTHSGEALEQLRHGALLQLQLHFWQLSQRYMRSCRRNCLDISMPMSAKTWR
jgi:hypothetical protein